VELEEEISLVGDGGYLRAILVGVPIKGEGVHGPCAWLSRKGG
jgi:hypothetical protein